MTFSYTYSSFFIHYLEILVLKILSEKQEFLNSLLLSFIQSLVSSAVLGTKTHVRSRDIIHGIITRRWAEKSEVLSRVGKSVIFTEYQNGSAATQPRLQWGVEGTFLEVKWQKRDADSSLTPSVEVKHELSYRFTPQHVFKVCVGKSLHFNYQFTVKLSLSPYIGGKKSKVKNNVQFANQKYYIGQQNKLSHTNVRSHTYV